MALLPPAMLGDRVGRYLRYAAGGQVLEEIPAGV
jgi:hypothetical protein